MRLRFDDRRASSSHHLRYCSCSAVGSWGGCSSCSVPIDNSVGAEGIESGMSCALHGLSTGFPKGAYLQNRRPTRSPNDPPAQGRSTCLATAGQALAPWSRNASGHSGTAPVMDRVQEFGFGASIAKPFGIDELGIVIAGVLADSGKTECLQASRARTGTRSAVGPLDTSSVVE